MSEKAAAEKLLADQKERIKNLEEQLAGLLPHGEKLNQVFSTFNEAMSPELTKLKEVGEQMKNKIGEFKKLTEFMSSPEVKAAAEQYIKNKAAQSAKK